MANSPSQLTAADSVKLEKLDPQHPPVARQKQPAKRLADVDHNWPLRSRNWKPRSGPSMSLTSARTLNRSPIPEAMANC